MNFRTTAAVLLCALSLVFPAQAQRQPGAPLQGLSPQEIETVMARLTPELADCWVYFEAARSVFAQAGRPREEIAALTAFRDYVRSLLEVSLNRQWVAKADVDAALAVAKAIIVEEGLNADASRFPGLQQRYGGKCTALARNFDSRLLHWILLLGY